MSQGSVSADSARRPPPPTLLAGEIRRTSRRLFGLGPGEEASADEATLQDAERQLLASPREGQDRTRRRSSFRAVQEEALREAAVLSLEQRLGNCLSALASILWILLLINLIAIVVYVELTNILVLGRVKVRNCDRPLWIWLFFRIGQSEVEMIQGQMFFHLRLLWNLVGWQWYLTSEKCGVDDEELHSWVHFVLLFDMICLSVLIMLPFLIAVCIYIFRILVDRGYIRNPNAARQETIDNLHTITFQEDLFADPDDERDTRPSRECCCCMEEFTTEKPIVLTPCKHYIHESCLRDWLQLARTCPICRNDLDVAVQQNRSSAGA